MPENPYRRGSLIWSIMEGDWGDLTVSQIAEVMDCSRHTVVYYLSQIKRETGYAVPHTRQKNGRSLTSARPRV